MNLKNFSIEALNELSKKYPYDKEIMAELESRTIEAEKVSVIPLYICLALMLVFLVLAIINRLTMNLEFLGLSIIGFLVSTSWSGMLLLKLKKKFL